jgi:type I restriction enzyme S subunit
VGGEFVYVSPLKAASLSRNLAGPGDIIATQRGTLGQVGIVPPQPDTIYVVSQSQMRLRVDPRLALGEYVYVALSTDAVRDEIESRKIATANPHINLGIFGAVEIPLPDLDTQTRIAGTVLAIEEAEAAAAREEEAIRALRSALLADLLAGNHAIPPSYDRFLDGAA